MFSKRFVRKWYLSWTFIFHKNRKGLLSCGNSILVHRNTCWAETQWEIDELLAARKGVQGKIVQKLGCLVMKFVLIVLIKRKYWRILNKESWLTHAGRVEHAWYEGTRGFNWGSGSGREEAKQSLNSRSKRIIKSKVLATRSSDSCVIKQQGEWGQSGKNENSQIVLTYIKYMKKSC